MEFRENGKRGSVVRARLLIALLASTVLSATIAASVPGLPAWAQENDGSVRFSIPAQPLSSAIDAFSLTTGWQVGYSAQVARVTTRAVSGSMPPARALQAMVSGLNLSIRMTGPTSVALIDVSQQGDTGAVENGSTALEAITVFGAGAATEGTGSYTTREMSTATGIPLSIKETPQSVSVVTRQRMSDQSLNTTADILKTTPGIQVQEWDSQRTEPFSRGFYLDSFQYDGVPLNNLIAMYGEHRSDTLQYDRVEVLRGANGLITGAGKPAGAVNFVRKHATSDVLSGEASITVGSWNDFRETLDATSPLNADASVRGRVIISRNDADSYLDRQETGSGLFYGIVDADLGPDTRLSFGAEHQDRALESPIWSGLPVFFSNGMPTRFPRGLNTAPDWAFWDTKNTTAFVSFEHVFDNDWKLQADAIHVHKQGAAKLLYTWGQPDAVTGLGLDPSPAQFSHDATQTVLSAKISGSYELLGRDHEFFSGVTADRMDEDYIYRAALNAAPVGSVFDFDGSYPEPDWRAPSLRVSRIDQLGAFAATRLNVTNALKFIGGLRFSRFETKTVSPWISANADQAQNAVTPYFGVTYDLDPTLTVYASYADVFRPQTERDISGRYLDPAIGSNIEAGIKSSWFDDRVNGSVAVFRTMEDNAAVATGVYIPGTMDFAYRAAKGVETRGIEGEISGEIASGWNLSLGATWLQSEDAHRTEINTTIPREMVRLFTTYTPQGNWEKLTIGGGLSWQGETYLPISTVNGEVRYTQSPYATASLMARYDFSETFSAQLNVENLFDKRYVQILEGDEQISFGAPRRAYLRLSAKF